PRAKYSIYAIDKCESKWTTNGKGSGNLQILVFSQKTKTFYKNVFCAICNDDENELKAWTSQLHCTSLESSDHLPRRLGAIPSVSFANISNYSVKKNSWHLTINESEFECFLSFPEFQFDKLVNELNARPCVATIASCPKNYTNENVAKKCSSYTSIVRYRTKSDENHKVYKNFYCALCNGEKIENFMSKTRHRMEKVPKGGQRLWYPLLLDFNVGRDSGKYVGERRLCRFKDGKFYNPLTEQCETFVCQNTSTAKSSSFCSFLNDDKENKNDDEKGDKSSRNKSDEKKSKNKEVYFKTNELPKFKNESKLINRTVKVYDRSEYENSKYIPTTIAQWKSLFTEVIQKLSIVGLSLHLIIYSLVPKLHNVPGKCLMSLSFALLMANICFAIAASTYIIQSSSLCLTVALFVHYFYLASFFWMNVISFDMYKCFDSGLLSLRSWDNRCFLVYSLYSWLSPAAFVVVGLCFDVFTEENIFQPLYGFSLCWINRRSALLIYFGIPLTTIISVNTIFFTLTAMSLIKTNCETSLIRNNQTEINILLHLKLSLTMGLTWIFGIVFAFTENTIFWFLFTVFNGLQGTFIFIAFTMKRQVLAYLLQKFCFKSKQIQQPLSISSSLKSIIGYKSSRY
ncbi:hypothetical protein B4U79_13826, partial [Dinothrombium tinctorium]